MSTQRRYTAELWLPDPEGHRLVAARRMRSERCAVRQVERWLRRHDIIATRYTYHRDIARAAYGDVRRDGVCVASVSARVDLVPSVSEVGWAP